MPTENTPNQLRSSQHHINIHGHRGARGILPENTLDSFRFCFDIGVRVIELDLLMTADGVPVITHNPQLMPYSTRDAEGNWLQEAGPLVADTTFAELQHYDVGGLQSGTDYAGKFPEQAFLYRQKIPAFLELCELVRQPEYTDVWLNVEIKSNPYHSEYTPPISDYVRGILKPILDLGLQQRVILQSFDWRVVHECARQAPEIPRSYLTYMPTDGDPMEINVAEGSLWMDGLHLADYGNSLPELIAADGGQVWSPYYEDLQAEDMAKARELGLIVNVWTVNEIEDIDHMIALGVDGIITDYPGRVQRRLLDNGLHWKVLGLNL